MGTPRFAVPSLAAVIDAGYEAALCVTQPDKPVGRGMKVQSSAVKLAALERGIRCLEPASMRDAAVAAELRAIAPDFIVVVAYGKILPQTVLDIPGKGCVNLHASILPFYRGASPVNRAIMNGDRETGVCTMLMDRGMDTGPVYLCEKTAIEASDDAVTLGERLSTIGASLLVKTLGLISIDKIRPAPQDNASATNAPPLKKTDGLIDWSRGAVEIRNLVAGTVPWPGAYTHWRGKVLKVHGGSAREGAGQGEPGTIAGIAKEGIQVSCGAGVFVVTEVQPEGKRRMKAVEFVSGYRVREGARLG